MPGFKHGEQITGKALKSSAHNSLANMKETQTKVKCWKIAELSEADKKILRRKTGQDKRDHAEVLELNTENSLRVCLLTKQKHCC